MNIIMPRDVHDKIMYWVDKADFEVSGFGTKLYDGKDFHVTDAILLKQEGGATHTDIDAQSLSKAQYELRNAQGDLRFWWHSHVNMQAFMSGTDTTTIKEIAEQGWCVAAVFNKRREHQTAIAYKYETPFAGSRIHYEEKIPLLLQSTLTPERIAELDAQYAEHVTEKKWTPMGRDFGGYADWDEYMNSWSRPAVKRSEPLLSARESYNDNGITPEIVEEARILGIKPKKWHKMCMTLSIAELDRYFEAINRGLSLTELSKEKNGLREQSLNQTY